MLQRAAGRVLPHAVFVGGDTVAAHWTRVEGGWWCWWWWWWWGFVVAGEGLISAEVINYERVSFSKTELETPSAAAPVSFQKVWMKSDSVHSWSAASSVTRQINASTTHTHTHAHTPNLALRRGHGQICLAVILGALTLPSGVW